ncbi:MAG: dynamin family protein [Thiohalophilus sp.]|uniref:dynamin family protein n=1 Tax=Thiohalophilus sp. TaxID=3028392 RepID=UPI00286FD43F|nr:dynamin family protein [Thiohalophilus sp.]MDR9436614.1 dynamin family protein [Thiohalophilus sp.]
MATDRFTDQMQAYGRWRGDLSTAIEKYQQWLNANNMSNPEAELRIFELLDALKSDRLTIAFVAEFARGKTELINAIFFSEYDRRLLPSEAGRTTMCPTELFYDSDADMSYIRLLPIETRLEEMSIQEHKKNPINWTTIELDTNSSEKMAEAFREVIRTKRVPAPVAEKLGLVDPDVHAETDMVEIPMWRHGLISFPHPLLKEGLTILDTPGLNAIGNEPELTLNMLPNSQAVVFVLAADTGVTKSDMQMWNQHVKPLGGDARHGRIIVLNKVDTLWDELKSDDEIDNSVAQQCKSAAKMLEIEAANVFPVSAQKGLLAKIRTDNELLQRSNILALESILAKDILPRKQHLVRESIVGEIGGMAQQSRDLIASRLADTNKQLNELKSLSGKNEDVIMHLMKKTREEQSTYHKSVESFQANRKTFNDKHTELLNTLSLTRLDKLMSKTRKEMSGSKFTMTLKGSMKEFFDIIQETMDTASKQTDQINMLLQTIYRQFNKDHGLTDVKPRLISMGKYKRELDRLYHEAEGYRNSAKLTVTEQAFVVKKFFISMVSHARNILFQAHQDVEAWGKNAMAPLVVRIKEHKNQMEKRLESLRKINESRDTLQNRIQELEKTAEALNVQLADINLLMETLNRPLESFMEQDTAQVA